MRRSLFCDSPNLPAPVVWVVLVLTLWIAPLGHAQETFEVRLRAGITHYNAGRYEESIGEFQAAYAQKPLPNLLFNIAQAHRRLGHVRQAVLYYQQFLREEANPTPDIRADILKYIEEAPKGQRVDRGKSKRKKPLGPKAPQGPAVEPEETKDEPPPVLSPPPQQTPPTLVAEKELPKERTQVPLYKRWWVWGLASVVVAGAVTSVVLGVQAATAPPPEPMVQPTYDLFR